MAMGKFGNGGKAFPSGTGSEYGMTLRDYFAAKVMIGLLTDETQRNGTTDSLVETAFVIADAMLAERVK